MFEFNSLELLIIVFLFTSAGNIFLTYFICQKTIMILKKTKSIAKAVNSLRVYDQFILSKVNFLVSILYFGIAYYFVSSIYDGALVYFYSLLLSFFLTLISVFFARVTYSYAGNILLESKLSEWACFKENFKKLIVTYIPFFIFLVFLPPLYIMEIETIQKIVYSFIFLMIFLILWVASTPKILIITLGAKKIEVPFLKERLEKLLKEHEIKKFHLYYWSSLHREDKNAFVSGYYIYYVLVSSKLLDDLSIEELKAIVTHEIGHIKKNHLLKLLLVKFFMVAIISSMIIVPYLISFSSFQISLYYTITSILFVMLLFYDLTMERVYENEADMYAKKHTNDYVFESAIKKISIFEEEEKECTAIDDFFSTHPSLKERVKKSL